MGLLVKDVDKTFGTKKVVDKISFEINKPSVYGLLGTNGAGKTTTIRMLLGIIKKDCGIMEWNKKPIIRKNVNFGYLPEERGIYPKDTIYNQLMYFSKLKGMKSREADEAIKYWLHRFEVDEYIDMQAEKLSKGNKQKIQIILSLLNDPELLILDEPFSGLDPINTEILKNVITELVDKGCYIIMSSHQMNRIEEFCEDILLLDRGKTVLQGNLKQIKASYKTKSIQISSNEDITEYIQNYNIVKNANNEIEILVSGDNEGKEILRKLVNSGVDINKFEFKKPSLDDIFVEKVGK